MKNYSDHGAQQKHLTETVNALAHAFNAVGEHGLATVSQSGYIRYISFSELGNGEAKLRFEIIGPRIAISGCWPSGRVARPGTDSHYETFSPARHDELQSPEITVTLAKGAEAIVADIVRRLLPGYTRALEYQQGRRDAFDAAYAKTRNVAHRLSWMTSFRVSELGGLHGYCPGGSYEVRSAESIKFTLDLNMEQSKKLATLLQTF